MTIYIGGYIDDRINRGDKREYIDPSNGGLPQFPPGTEFPDLEPSMVSAQRLKAKQQNNKNAK